MTAEQRKAAPPFFAQGIEGQVALVTGASGGLGRGCALALSAAGATVIAVARHREKLEKLAAEALGTVHIWPEDVTADAVLQRIEALDCLHIMVNNAGTNIPQGFLEVDDHALDQVIALNLRAAFRVARSAARVMVRNNYGSIINMSSQMGHVGAVRRSVYCMTKHGLEGLTKAMAVELARHNIRVNSVAPTFIETPLTQPFLQQPGFRDEMLSKIPSGRFGSIEEVAAAVSYLASPAAAIVTGSSLKVDGGWTAQ